MIETMIASLDPSDLMIVNHHIPGHLPTLRKCLPSLNASSAQAEARAELVSERAGSAYYLKERDEMKVKSRGLSLKLRA
jgi:hypothetical protein